MSELVDHLHDHGDRVAVLTETTSLTYRELADRVAAVAAELGATRRLVLLETRNDLSTLVHYLGCAGRRSRRAADVRRASVTRPCCGSYDPDVVIDDDGIHERRHGSAHRLHPDLALLMSTSGSTGSPKLVRLSRCNLVANATAIAEYLDIRRNRQGRNDSPDVVLLRPFGDPQPPAARRRADPHRSLGRRRGVLGAVPSAPRHLVRRSALHLRDARADRLRRHRPARSALRHPGRWAAVTGTRAQLRRRSAHARAGSCSSCTAPPRPPPEWLTCHQNSRSHIPARSAGRSPAAPSPSSRSRDGPIPTWASWCITGRTS